MVKNRRHRVVNVAASRWFERCLRRLVYEVLDGPATACRQWRRIEKIATDRFVVATMSRPSDVETDRDSEYFLPTKGKLIHLNEVTMAMKEYGFP